MIERGDLGWESKYSTLAKVKIEEQMYREYFPTRYSSNPPKIFSEPNLNPFLQYHELRCKKKDKEVKVEEMLSLMNLKNYFSATKLLLLHPLWFEFFVYASNTAQSQNG